MNIKELDKEHFELTEKIAKLASFMGSLTYLDLDQQQKDLLTIQHSVMISYHQIIQARLIILRNQNKQI